MAIHQMLKCDLIPLDPINQFTWGDLKNIHENNRLLAGNNIACRHEVITPAIPVRSNNPYISSNGYYGYSPINVHTANINDSKQGDCEMETASTDQGMENDFGTHPNCGAGMVNYSQQQFGINGSGGDSHYCTQNLGRRKRNYTGVASYPVKKIRANDSAPSPMIDREKSFMGAGSSCSPSDTYPRCIMGHYI